MAGEMIYLSHRDKKCHHAVKRTLLLSDLLLKERRCVLFVGEGNFTFTVAFTALRQFEDTRDHGQRRLSVAQDVSGHRVWEGIVSSRYEPVGSKCEHQFVGSERVQCKPAPVLSEVKLVCINESVKYFNFTRRYRASDETSLSMDQSKCFERITSITDLPTFPDTFSWQYRIDARHLPSDLLRECGVVWFQCPWSRAEGGAGDLIVDFLVNSAKYVAGGSYVCVGIIKHPDYVGGYGLEGILQGGVVREWYTLVGADDELVQRVLEYGYKQESDSDIHHYLLDSHLTLVFQRN